MIYQYILIASIILSAFVLAKRTVLGLAYFQQHEYHDSRYLLWWMKNYPATTGITDLFIPLLMVIEYLFLKSNTVLFTAINIILFVGSQVWCFFSDQNRYRRLVKPLVYTPRAVRILVVALLLMVCEFLVVIVLAGCEKSNNTFSCSAQSFILIPIGNIFIGHVIFINLVLASFILYPIDILINEYYLFSARRKLRSINPIVIGITGSFGKTSTKHILAHLLSDRYNVLGTPKSYNTLMGVCRVVNESLKPNHRYFIVEMGAYREGEIRRICNLVRPRIGIITAIGPQHLERFKTQEKIAQAKYELIEALPADGIAIFNGDDNYCQQLSRITKVKTLQFGIANKAGATIWADNIATDINGTKYVVHLEDGRARSIKAKLLGKQNVLNGIAAIIAAIQCDVPFDQIAHSLVTVPQFEHRMQLIKTGEGIYIIDNAYSSNPASARFSLDTLNSIPCTGKKIIVTPGFAELGKSQDKEHYFFGQEIADVCNLVFLIGDNQRTAPILEGLENKGFPRGNIFLFRYLTDARKEIAKIAKPGDIVLFENDMPDIY